MIQRSIKRLLFFLITVLILYGAWLMLRLTLPYTAFNRYTDFLMTKQLVYHIRYWRVSFYVHVFISITVLITGLLQCSRYLLQKYPRLHRSSGKTYAVIVLFFSGPSGLIMSFYANGGWPARISFVLLSLLWIGSTGMGWRYALQRRWQQHGNMMLRSYALTLSALTLRFYAYLIDVFNIPIRPVTSYITIAWLSWTLNLLIMEWWISARRKNALSHTQ
ncbi:DUF2306 domain-containing protein [Chitinophaga agrisoli]|uniref:DUF2306 domain-containing protein n=1 Tax=Chitinophaga agrisoli TaxID=2607653 RepID=A0A5B2W4A3_9BACT|nr:DUF2306 domain-containing protein [Chitinophaga agrisoli]KAA2245089.1 DUF2306 domain-containing protein [Chitinophaga agrisoli]